MKSQTARDQHHQHKQAGLGKVQHNHIHRNTTGAHRLGWASGRMVLTSGITVALTGWALTWIYGTAAQVAMMGCVFGLVLAAVSYVTAKGRSIEEAYRLGYDVGYEVGWEGGYKRGTNDCWDDRVASQGGTVAESGGVPKARNGSGS